MSENQEFQAVIQQYPSIKITKNTKGWNYEFKILSNDVQEMTRLQNAIESEIKKWESQNAKK